MSETTIEIYDAGTNPYGVSPAANISMTESRHHESGNALAANAEARAVAEVKAQVLMARQFPREPHVSMDRILHECERPSLAEKAVYAFPRGKETVTGPSIRLAEMMARNWGNCTFGFEVLERKQSIGRTPGQSIIRAYAWDLETNTLIARQFELAHFRATRSGGYALTDDRDIYELEANMASRRMRACILQMLPGDATQAAVDKCRVTLSDGLTAIMSDPAKRGAMIAKITRSFEGMGITQVDLEKYLETRTGDWKADHALRLRELKNSLEDGAMSIGDVFPHLASENRNAVITKEQSEELMRLAKDSGKQGDISKALKSMGIAKMADIPADKFGDIRDMILALMPEKDRKSEPVQATFSTENTEKKQ